MNKGIHVQAPTTSYSLAFKHLRGEVKLVLPPTPRKRPHDDIVDFNVLPNLRSWDTPQDPPSTEPELVYASGGRHLNQWEVIQILMESPPLEQLPDPMLRGHTLATAVYVGGCLWFTNAYEIGVALVPGPNHKVTRWQLRRAALTEAVAGLPAVDRAYFHLVLSEMEGQRLELILKGILHDKPADREVLLKHLSTQRKYYNWIRVHPGTGRMQVFNRERDE